MAFYTGQSKVPTVQEFREIEKQREQASLDNCSGLSTDVEGEAAPVLQDADVQGTRQRKNAASQADDDDDAPADSQFAEQSGQAEKERLKKQSSPQGKPTDNFQNMGKR